MGAKTWEELLASRGIKLPTKLAQKVNPQINIIPTEETEEKEDNQKDKTFSLSIILDEEQQNAVELALAGKSFCLIGKAGTGKTTTEREIVKALLKNNKNDTHLFRIQGTGEKHEGPAAAVVAYTRIASGNSRNAICKDAELAEIFYHNVTTVHNLLEYAPEFFWDVDKEKESMRFVPKRTRMNPLTVKTICFEESSMIDLTLWERVYDAMLGGTQCIFIGDINQLPPVFGPSILNFALVQLPIVELNTVYRQAFNSLVLKNAHNILEGKELETGPDFKILEGGETQQGQLRTRIQVVSSLEKWYKNGTYRPEEDIILSPFNKGELGTDALNNHIAQFLNENEVYEIIAGVRKFYLAVGDKIMYQKQTGVVTAIKRNSGYSGRQPKMHSKNLDRFGHYRSIDVTLDDGENEDDGLAHIEFDLEQMSSKDMEELSHQSSHVVEITLDTGEELSLSKTGELSATTFSLAYALTVHKSQGCEWRKVIIIMHKDHSILCFNELLYTAVTRAAKEVVIIAKKFMIKKAIATRRLKGSSIADKIEYFNANMDLGNVSCVKV